MPINQITGIDTIRLLAYNKSIVAGLKDVVWKNLRR
jgi:hypothetical protein